MDNNEKKPLNVYIFVARGGNDNDEYDRYVMERSSDEQYGGSPEWASAGQRFQWRFSHKARVLRVKIEKGKIDDCLYPPEIPCQDRIAPDLYTYYAANKANKASLRNRVKAKVESVFVDNNSGAVMTFLHELKDKEGRSILEDSKILCRIFIHWGGGESELVLGYERAISEFLPKDSSWRVYSLGTNRNHLFNVDRQKIIIPSQPDVLDELDWKFYNEQKFAGCLTDAPLSKAAASTPENRTISIRVGEIMAVRERLCEMKNRVLLSNLNENTKLILLSSIMVALNDFKCASDSQNNGEEIQIVINEDTAKLAKKIMNKEVFNG